MELKLTFFLDNDEVNITTDMNFIDKIGENIKYQLINNKKQYSIQSKVKLHNLKAFLNYISNNKEPLTINPDNYLDFYNLNDEFNHIIDDILSKPEYNDIKNESIFNNLVSKEINDKSVEEKHFAKNLDYYLDKYFEKMSEIPINSLYNIFNDAERDLKNHEKAYQFIIQNINKNNENKQSKQEFCILLGALDGLKMSEKSLNESTSEKAIKEHFGYHPKINDSIICSINKNITEMKNQNDSNFEKLFSLINAIASKYDVLSSKVDGMQQSFVQQHEKESIINEQNIEKIDDIQNSIQKLVQRNENESTHLQQNTEKINDIQNSIQQLKEKINVIQNNSQQMEQKIIEINDCTKLHFKLEHDHFNGIIRQLTNECNGNVHDKKIVNVTSSSCNCNCLAKYAVDLDDENHYFASDDVDNSWLKYEFLNNNVCVTHYSIRTTFRWGVKKLNLMNWVIEASHDDKNWTILDYRKNVSVLDNYHAVHTFDIQKKSNEYFKYLRIKQNGPNSNDTHYLILSALEFFGSIQ